MSIQTLSTNGFLKILFYFKRFKKYNRLADFLALLSPLLAMFYFLSNTKAQSGSNTIEVHRGMGRVCIEMREREECTRVGGCTSIRKGRYKYMFVESVMGGRSFTVQGVRGGVP